MGGELGEDNHLLVSGARDYDVLPLVILLVGIITVVLNLRAVIVLDK